MFEQRTGYPKEGGQIGWLGWLLNPRGCYGDGTVAGDEEGTEGCCLEGSSVWSPSKGDDVLRSVCLDCWLAALLPSQLFREHFLLP